MVVKGTGSYGEMILNTTEVLRFIRRAKLNLTNWKAHSSNQIAVTDPAAITAG